MFTPHIGVESILYPLRMTILTFQKTFKVKIPLLKRKFDISIVNANFRATM